MVFETRPGDVFLLGASSWRVLDITHDRVLVAPAPGEPGRMPFWRGDGPGRPLDFGRGIGALSRRLTFEHRLRVLAVEGRFAALIVQFARCLGEPHDGGSVFSLPLLRAELASYLGLRTETICRVLARWQKSGLITLKGRRIFVIRSLAEMEALSAGAGQ